MNSAWPDGRHHDLFQRADLAFAHNGKSGQQHNDKRDQVSHHSRHKKPLAAQVGIEPRLPLQHDRRHLR